jgi:hypothetical protein
MTKRAPAHAQLVNGLGDARPWRQWAKDNCLGVNRVWRAISERKLKVRRIGRRMIVLASDGDAYLRSLPEGPGFKPTNFQKAAE